jgi:glycine cleavage system transcriptional repressor
MHAAITAVGNDRPGIVAAISNVLFEAGGNIEDSRMAILGGHFAVVLIVALERGDLDSLERRLQEATAGMDLTIAVRPVAEVTTDAGDGPALIVRVYGADRPGIVARVSSLLARHRVNIRDLATHVTGGDPPVYVMLIEGTSESTDVRALEGELAALAAELGVEVSTDTVDPETL